MMVNKKMAQILGMDTPDSDDEEVAEIVEVPPHEIVDIGNPDLPPLADIDSKQAQAEKQLETVINDMLQLQKTLVEEIPSIDPKYRSRYVEVANGTMAIALKAIQTKISTQEAHKAHRMDAAKFEKNDKGGGDTTNNYFYGSREDLRDAIRKDQNDDDS